MIFTPLALAGAWAITLEPRRDERGFFARTFDTSLLAQAGLTGDFPQHSIAWNARAGTVRGMHFTSSPHEETKIVRCTTGAAYDVIVDLRADSPTYRKSCALELRSDNHVAIYVPPGFAHGYQTLSDGAELLYLITPAYVPGYAAGVRHDDPALDVRWPIPISAIADRDRGWPPLVPCASS